ncbi:MULTISPECIES: Gfo/Idh/MocA family oxidoreductase [unclassified Spirosoma]|uniref:Gfo/Idh/MocA family protein n=1 Tax=unclassified Spirosoma TaxID=2621999 RepID=UPI00095CA87E|nr:MULTISPECIES: Gfo/Idh/MocA family oxidoreductase [unclassified Spirosoma]MBN8821580.1 Gfo/Idh/MocA family oxidoreductase [Spirosoma sp.]OJW78352.1 MAG: oxidoreductase [Spirosoma sp. 48-14]
MIHLNWGIIGCGDVTEVKSGPAFNKIPHSSLVAVMRRDADKAADYAHRHKVPKWYTDADALINDPDVNAIYIATPPDSHADYAIRAMRAGKPTYVEKPMALNTAECEAMNQVSRETGIPLFVAFYRRALPYFLKVKELIDQKAIGDVRYVHIQLNWEPADRELGKASVPNWRVTPAVSGGGLLHDLASHQFDFLEFLLGPVQSASGITRNQAGLYEADDVVVANFAFESGVLGSGNWCWTVNKEQRLEQTQLIGSTGKLTFSFFENFVIKLETESGTEEITVPFPEHVQQPLIELIVQELRGEGKSPSTGETGIRSSQILDWITAP